MGNLSPMCKIFIERPEIPSTANIYYSSDGDHEQKNKKTTSPIKFSTVTTKQWIKLALQHSLKKINVNV